MWPSEMEFPGTFSDMFVRPPETKHARDDEFIAYTTPTRADYWWGAYLVSRVGVTKINLPTVLREWDIRLGSLIGIDKKIIQWELPVGVISSVPKDWSPKFLGRPASISTSTVLVAKPSKPLQTVPTHDMTLVEARTESDFAEILHLALADLESTPGAPATEDFLRWKHDQFHKGVLSAGGKWWMLKYKGEFVANCGLFNYGRTARFREVTTHPRWRRQGFARILCQQVLDEGFKDPAIEQVVIVAECGSSAERVYRSIGFAPQSLQFALMWDLK